MFLSKEEINSKFDGEWIYAIDCEEVDVFSDIPPTPL